MAIREFFKTPGGSIELKSNSEFTTGDMSPDYESAVVYIAAYDANGNIVTPAAGTATVSFEDMAGSYSDGVADGDNPIDLTKTGAESTYLRPLYLGCCIGAKITLSGVDFAAVDHVKAFVWRAK